MNLALSSMVTCFRLEDGNRQVRVAQNDETSPNRREEVQPCQLHAHSYSSHR